MNINTLSLEQLKALAFDEIVKKDQAQTNLQILQTAMEKILIKPQEINEEKVDGVA